MKRPVWQRSPIPVLAHELAPALRALIDGKTKPIGSLGRLEELALRLGLMQATDSPKLTKPVALIFAGDHGIAADGVSLYPPEVTPQMVENILSGGAGINALAKISGIKVKVVDAGVAVDLPDHPDLKKLKVRHGTRNCRLEPALTADEVILCLSRGAWIVRDVAARGTNAILPGEMGIGNSSAAALIYSALLDRPLSECVGMGTGHHGKGLKQKLKLLTEAKARHAESREPLAVLAAFGGCEIAMMTGAMLEAAARRMVVMVDGFIATAAALIAARLDPAVTGYFVFSHASGDRVHEVALEAFDARPLLDLDMRLGEATGAAMAWPLMQAAAGFLHDMATFDSAGVSKAAGR